MMNPSDSRSILVYEAADNSLIFASHPSDCELLCRDHTQFPSHEVLTVKFDESFMYKINGPGHPETLEDWRGAVQHLLSTYQPRGMSMSFGDSRPGIQGEFTVNVRDGGTYTGFLTRDQREIYLRR